jgi:hypothetical protein
MRIRLLTIALTVALAALTLFSSGCGDDPKAFLRVVHASPDAPNVDVLVDGKTVLTNVAYGTGSNYLKVKAGSRKIEVRATGTTADVINVTVTLDKNNYYTALATNFLANITPLLLTDDNTAPPSGQVKARLVHAAPSAPNVDIYVVAPGTDINTVSPTVTDLAFGAATSYLTVAAGSYQVLITPTGTKDIAIDTGSLSLASGQIRTGVALDAPGGGTPFKALLLADLN